MSLLTTFGVVLAALFVTALGLNKAFAEIEMEGKDGWAAKSATSYRVTTPFAKFYAKQMNGKPVTFWNVSEQLFFFLAVTSLAIPWIIYVPKSAGPWVIVEAVDYGCLIGIGFMAWLAVYDFHWFLFHPHYNPGGKYTWNWTELYRRVWWHKVRIERDGPFKGLPIDYPAAAVVIVALAIARSFIAWSPAPFVSGTIFTVSVIAFTVIAYKWLLHPYQAWYNEAHKPENDERHLAIPEDCR